MASFRQLKLKMGGSVCQNVVSPTTLCELLTQLLEVTKLRGKGKFFLVVADSRLLKGSIVFKDTTGWFLL